MTQWEYWIERLLEGKSDTEAEDRMDALGKEGWELAANDRLRLIFKRPVQPPVDPPAPAALPLERGDFVRRNTNGHWERSTRELAEAIVVYAQDGILPDGTPGRNIGYGPVCYRDDTR